MQGTASALNSTNASSGAGQTASTIIAIKQESLSTVDNLVGSYVDSTTFLPSPNNQLGNLAQSHTLTSDANGVNEGNFKAGNFLGDKALTQISRVQLQETLSSKPK